MLEKLDKTDMRILYELDVDSRQSNSQIAKKMKTSKDVVNYRIRKLSEEGIIRGFYTVIDTGRLGFLSSRFFIKLKNCPPQEENRVIRYFLNDPKYWWVDSMEGSRDIGVACWTRSPHEFYKEKLAFLSQFKKTVKDLNASIYTAFYVFKRAYLTGLETNPHKMLVLCSDEKEEIDDFDKKLLLLLSNNGRMPTTELASKLGVAPSTIIYRMRALEEKKIIQGYRPILDLGKIGYYWYKVEFMLKDLDAKKKMIGYFNAHPNIVFAYEAIGSTPDLEMEMEVRSYEEFRKVMQEIRERFRDSIESYEYWVWYKEHKISPFPTEL